MELNLIEILNEVTEMEMSIEEITQIVRSGMLTDADSIM